MDIDKGLHSIKTNYTISKVRTAQNNGKLYIVVSSFEGTVISVFYEGKMFWENKLLGFMNHDI